MKRAILALVLTAALAAAAAGQVSLWKGGSAATPGTASGVNLLREAKGKDFQIHDIITVVVILEAEASTDEQTQTEKKNDKNNFEVKQYLKLSKSKASLLGVDLQGRRPEDLGVDMTGDKKFTGTGTADRTDTLNTQLAAEVIDKKPNGNLVIEAKQTFTKQREKTTITFSGVVRPQDVAPDNTVFSYNVADADIRYDSTGPITDSSKRGWLAKIFDKVWPF